MSDTFIPLPTKNAPSGNAAIHQLTVLSQAEAKAAFEPLVQATRAEPASKPCARANVTLQRQGDLVTGIRIECTCGQVIELACTY